MAQKLQINQEHEASYNLIELSLEARVFLAFKYKTPNRYKLLDKLVRANVDTSLENTDKTIFLSEKAKKILRTILKKYFAGERILLNHKYLTAATRCKSDQNAKILKELQKILDIKYWDVFTNENGRKFLRHYEFKIHPAIVEELKATGLWDRKFHPDFNRGSYTNKNIFNRNLNRSSELSPTSNFSNANNSSCCTETTAEPDETKETVETSTPKETKNTKKQVKMLRPARVVSNGFLGKGKRLSEMQPYLTESMCRLLRAKSGRNFTDKAIKEITKAVAVSEKGRKAIFKHISGLVSYLTLILQNEKRNPELIGGEDYYTIAGMSEEDKLYKQQEDYLEGVEQTGMRQACKENQFRGKLANTLERQTAYNFLLAMKHAKLEKNTLVIGLNGHVELSEHERSIILAQAQAVFNGTDLAGNSQYVERIEFNMDKAPSYTASTASQSQIELSQGIWGKVAKSFIEEYGYDLYTHWLGDRVTVEEDAENQSIFLKVSSEIVKDRIIEKYLPFLSKSCDEFGIKKVEVNSGQ